MPCSYDTFHVSSMAKAHQTESYNGQSLLRLPWLLLIKNNMYVYLLLCCELTICTNKLQTWQLSVGMKLKDHNDLRTMSETCLSLSTYQPVNIWTDRGWAWLREAALTMLFFGVSWLYLCCVVDGSVGSSKSTIVHCRLLRIFSDEMMCWLMTRGVPAHSSSVRSAIESSVPPSEESDVGWNVAPLKHVPLFRIFCQQLGYIKCNAHNYCMPISMVYFMVCICVDCGCWRVDGQRFDRMWHFALRSVSTRCYWCDVIDSTVTECNMMRTITQCMIYWKWYCALREALGAKS